jgi:hypothetical protein
MPKKPSAKTLKKKCDALWGKIIRSRGYCEHCGKGLNLQAAHIFSRTYSQTRHDLDNGLCLCSACHIGWAHSCPTEFTEWLEEYRGKDLLERLSKKRRIIGKVDYEKVLEELKKIYENM